MTKTEDDIKYDGAAAAYESDVVATAVPDNSGFNKPGGEAPVPSGHSRFYCNKCHTPYDLPEKATSWRCQNCMEFNSTTAKECPMCIII